MTQINAYINFNGNCREAMNFYQESLGGELMLQTIGESPMAAQMPAEMKDMILHSKLSNNGMTIMSSDMIGAGLVKGNQVTLVINSGNEGEINSFFNNLSEGGTVKMALQKQFWGATYGELTDKFGIFWMFNCVDGAQ